MTDLIKRLEEATGSDRELDADIALLVGYRRKGAKSTIGISDGYVWAEPGEQFSYGTRPPSYSSSLDAALTLVPEGCGAKIHYDTAYKGYAAASVFPTREGEGHELAANVGMDKRTPDIALCIAALRARGVK